MFPKISDLFDPKGYFTALWPYRYTCFLFTHCDAKSKKWRATYAIILILGHSAMHWYSGIIPHLLERITNYFAQLMSITFQLTVVPLHIVIWFFVSYGCFMESVSSITHLDRDLANICSKHVNFKAMVRRQLICFFPEFIIYVPLVTLYLLMNSEEPLIGNLPYAVYLFSHHYGEVVNNLVISVFSNVVYFIGDRYALINSALEGTRDGDANGVMTNHSEESENALELIRQLRIVHRKLFSVSKKIMEGFSFQVLLCVLHVFFVTVWDSYLTYMLALRCRMHTTIDYFMIVVRIAHSLTPIVYMAYGCHRTVRKANETAKVLNSLIIHSNNMRLEISSFVHQIIHCQLHFSPFGFFQVDLAFFQSFIGSVATYLVILVQIQPTAPNGLEDSTK